MAWFTCAEKGSPLLEEKRRQRATIVVDFAAVGHGLPSVGGALCPNAVVGVGANDDGIVPKRPGGGALHLPAWCSTL